MKAIYLFSRKRRDISTLLRIKNRRQKNNISEMPTFIGISIVEQSRYLLVKSAQTIRNIDCKLAVSAEYRCFTGAFKPKLGTTSL